MAKARTVELAAKLREAAKAQDPIAKAAIELVKLSMDDAKESLVAADGDDMLRAQGSARQLQRLYKELTVTPPSISGATQ